MACESLPKSSDVQELHARLDRKRAEVEALEGQIVCARLDARQLRVQMRSRGIVDDALIPRSFKAGSNHHVTMEQQFPNEEDLVSLVKWLEESLDASRHVIFSVDGDIQVGEHSVHIGRMVQWNLNACGGVKLNVPEDLKGHVLAMLERSRRGSVTEEERRLLSETWEIMGAEMASSGRSAVPAIFLVHRAMNQAVVVAAWPAIDLVGPSTATKLKFDYDAFFAQREEAPGGPPPSPPLPPAVPPATILGTSPPEADQKPKSWIPMGARVEVNYRGEWFTGVLDNVDGDGYAHVRCDADAPGTVTYAPIQNVRPVTTGRSTTVGRCHLRSHSR